MEPTESTSTSTALMKDYAWSEWTASSAHAYIWPQLSAWIGECAPKSILDIGAGNGVLTAQIAKSTGIRTVGLEPSSSGVSAAEKLFPGLGLVQGGVDDPLPAKLRGQFDLVVSIEVLEHLLYPTNLLLRAKEALENGGKLILSTPYHGYWKNLAIALVDGFDNHFEATRDGGHVKFFSRKSITALLEQNGFQVDKFTTVGRFPPFGCSLMILASA